MEKWHSSLSLNNEIIISNRVRLARNLKKFPFDNFLTYDESNEILEKIKNTIINDRTHISNEFEYIKINEIDDIKKIGLIERNLISYELLVKELPSAVILKKDHSVSIMLNEEDHIRIQAIFSGYNIEKAFDEANRIDNLIEETEEYAFDEEYGYLTSCLTNVGTGMRASFMIHIPMLEKYGQINKIIQEVSKFGVTIRGIYGEGTKPLGGIYQISNQVTLGKTELEIINNLQNITLQIVEKEVILRKKIINKSKINFIDSVYRSYAILKYAKKISAPEAIKHLSNLWVGIYSNLIDEKINLKTSIYNIMTNCQVANLSNKFPDIKKIEDLDIYRAKFLNQVFSI